MALIGMELIIHVDTSNDLNKLVGTHNTACCHATAIMDKIAVPMLRTREVNQHKFTRSKTTDCVIGPCTVKGYCNADAAVINVIRLKLGANQKRGGTHL